MKGYKRISSLRSVMSSLCIALFLFSCVNATMFWHGHSTAGYWVFHSHIADSAHRSAPLEDSHNTAELLLIQAVNQASFTEDVIPACDLEPLREIVEIVATQPTSFSAFLSSETPALRGPPALV